MRLEYHAAGSVSHDSTNLKTTLSRFTHRFDRLYCPCRIMGIWAGSGRSSQSDGQQVLTPARNTLSRLTIGPQPVCPCCPVSLQRFHRMPVVHHGQRAVLYSRMCHHRESTGQRSFRAPINKVSMMHQRESSRCPPRDSSTSCERRHAQVARWALSVRVRTRS